MVPLCYGSTARETQNQIISDYWSFSESKRPVPVGGLVVSPETLQTVYITVGVVGGLVGVVTFSLCIHCCRVWNKR